MQPSGGRDPEKKKKPDNGTALTPGDPDTPTPSEPPTPPTPLELVVSVTPKDSLFARSIKPTLDIRCATSGCHSAPQVIDMRSFPFNAEGSFAMDDIRADLGADADPSEIQKRLVAVIIDSMRTLYMPPAPAEPVAEADIAPFDAWLKAGLETAESPFSGRFVVKATNVAGELVCETEGAIADGSFRGALDRNICEGASSASYEIFSTDDQLLAHGSITEQALSTLERWIIDIELE